MNSLTRLTAPLLAVFLIAPQANAQDYIALSVEAENYSQKNSLWRVFSNSSSPNINPDPDGSHQSSASGRAYVELLPDTRVTHGDPLSTGRNFWNTAGTGPTLSYNINIPEAGRYIVFAKAYSTGTEDNGIHVGLNNANPSSGHRMQWCNGKNKWTWSSAQRQSSNHCGVERTIYLDIPSAGANTIVFSAREDGFELDQFILLKEKTAGRKCSPNNNDQITCSGSASGTVTDGSTTVVRPESIQPTETQSNDSSGHPTCSSAASDSDGDGYGYENGQSCIVDTASDTMQQAADTSVPTCVSATADPDGDGWGWENNRSCLTNTDNVGTITESDDFPICQLDSSDTDQDGWGWENSRSCIVR